MLGTQLNKSREIFNKEKQIKIYHAHVDLMLVQNLGGIFAVEMPGYLPPPGLLL